VDAVHAEDSVGAGDVGDAGAEQGPPERCVTPDGLEIAVYDFGGSGRDLLLVHATGFCAEVFRPFGRVVGGNFHCWALDLRAHGRSDRPPDGDFSWSGFATDVLSAIEHLGLVRPMGFGHSCGGAALLLAEERKPGTFESLYCFEPIVFPIDGKAAAALPPDNPLSEGARRRRETFPSAEDAFVNFAAKPPFDELDPEVLRCYVEAGFEPIPREEGGDGSAIRLRCRREDEAAVYAEGPRHGAFERLGDVACPVSLSCGEHTDAIGPKLLELDASRLARANTEVIPGIGHFGPLQDPPLVAGSVLGRLVPGAVPPPS
jgi:pimeloyl-ACP methyl ester carboxylesterase